MRSSIERFCGASTSRSANLPLSSGRPRRLLLHQYRAADAWPLLGVRDFADYRGLLLCGEDTLAPRIEAVPVRLPLPPAAHQGSIYENQRARASRFFQAAGEVQRAVVS